MNETKTDNKLKLYWLFFLVPCGIVLTTLFFIVLYSIISKNSINNFLNNLGIQSFSFSMIIYTIATCIAVLILFYLLKKNNLKFSEIGFKGKLTIKGIIYAIIAFILASFLYLFIQLILSKFQIPMFWISDPRKIPTTINIIILFFTAVTTGAIAEDIIFRGYLFNMLRQRMNVVLSVLISVFIFSSIHLPAFGPGLTIYMLFWSLLSYGLYVKFDNIYPSILFHMLNNLTAYIIIPLIFGK